MARRHLPSKKRLGRHLDLVTMSVSGQLNRIVAAARAAAEAEAPTAPELSAGAAYWGVENIAPEDAGINIPNIEDLAIYQGADVLFAKGREGPITPLAIILIPEENRENRRIAALAANFGFVAHLSRQRKIAVAVPEGYVTDFASIPGLVQWLISPFGKHAEAAVVHDWLYTLGKPGDGKGRKLADLTFRRALKLVGVGFIRRNIMYWSVRMGGHTGYGLASDYDFRDLVELKRRTPMPHKSAFAYTWKEADIPKPARPGAKRGRTVGAPPPTPAQAPAPEEMPELAQAAPPPALSEAAAKAEAQETMVATETR